MDALKDNDTNLEIPCMGLPWWQVVSIQVQQRVIITSNPQVLQCQLQTNSFKVDLTEYKCQTASKRVNERKSQLLDSR